MRKSVYVSLFATASLLAVAGQAQAQATVGEIVVTGSRVVANGNDMPTPVTVVSTQELTQVHPGNIAESLNDLPVFNGSRGQTTNTGTNGAAGSPASSANAVNSVNLRQLGVQRSLVLYDGHRAAPSTADGTVDLDTIPQMLLQRVDVVTGGASAVYGSEAITGVVNFVTDSKFKGLKANIQVGRSYKNDADAMEGGIAAGGFFFDDRLHLEGSFESRHQEPLTSKFDREWGKNVYTLQGRGTAAEPYYQVSGARVSNLNAAGRVNNATLGDSQFSSGGFIVPFVHGTRLGLAPAYQASNNCATCEIGGDGGVFNGQLRASLDMNQYFGRADFDFTPDVHGYLTAAFTENRSVATGNYTSNAAYAISRDNAFLLPQYRTALGTATTFNLGKIFTEIPRGQTESHAGQMFVVAALQGKIGDNWAWEGALTKSDGEFKVQNNTAINQGRFFAALDSVVSNGVPVCRASLTNANYAGCVPLNPFGTNAGSAQSVNYFMTKLNWLTKVGMEQAAGNITGSPFSTWAGPVNVAISAEARKLTYEIQSRTPATTARADCVGIALGCLATTNVYSSSIASVPQVSQKVSEAAVEVLVPLLKDAHFAKSLQFTGAARLAHYDRAGDAKTWKAGATWDVNDMLTVRATRSRDFRAPTLDENFRATSLSAPARNFGDTLPGNPDARVGQNPLASTLNGGNLDLAPEFGDTFTYGFVVRPFQGFSLSVDVFDIKVKNAIFLIQGNTPAYQNACYAGGGTSASNPGSSQYCQLIVRDASGSVTQWKQTFINLAELRTNGVDIEAGYRTDVFGRPLSLRVLSTYQPHLIYKQPGIVDSDYAGSAFGTNGLQGNPKWRLTAFATFKPIDTVTIAVQQRWRSELPKVDGAPANAAAPAIFKGGPIKSFYTTNLNVTYAPELNGKPEFFVNVQNLFNKEPVQAGFWGNPTPGQFGEFVSGDDVIGRYFTVGARVRY